MPGKRTNGGRSHSRDERQPRVVSDLKKLEQSYWRKDCLRAREAAETLTEKNLKEMERLGMGKPTSLESKRSERT